MSALQQQLSFYAAYHRDPRNVATHLVGIPMIYVAIVVLLSTPWFHWQGWPVSAALVIGLAACVWYLRLDLRYGLVMTALTALCLVGGQRLEALGTVPWLAWGLGLFVVGWIFQAIGHVFEGRKPAFLDDLRGLLVGPLFVVAEVGFALGLRRELRAQLAAR